MDDEELLSLLPNREEVVEEPRVEDEPTPEVEAAPVEADEPAKGPERGPDGKFVAKAEAEPEPGLVPLAALLDERDKRKKFEDQLRELQRQANPPATPEPTEVLQAQRYADNLRFSRKFAEREYGKDTIATVHDWVVAKCDADPAFNEQMRQSEDPYEAAYQAYNRAQLEPLIADVKPADFAAFKAWQAQQAAGDPIPAQQPPAAQAAPVAVPKSLVNAPGNGAAGKPFVDQRPGAAFEAAIPR